MSRENSRKAPRILVKAPSKKKKRKKNNNSDFWEKKKKIIGELGRISQIKRMGIERRKPTVPPGWVQAGDSTSSSGAAFYRCRFSLSESHPTALWSDPLNCEAWPAWINWYTEWRGTSDWLTHGSNAQERGPTSMTRIIEMIQAARIPSQHR